MHNGLVSITLSFAPPSFQKSTGSCLWKLSIFGPYLSTNVAYSLATPCRVYSATRLILPPQFLPPKTCLISPKSSICHSFRFIFLAEVLECGRPYGLLDYLSAWSFPVLYSSILYTRNDQNIPRVMSSKNKIIFQKMLPYKTTHA